MVTYNCPNSLQRIEINTECPVADRNISSGYCTTLSSDDSTKGTTAVFDKFRTWPQGSTININFINGEEWQRAWVQKVVLENLAPIVGLEFKFGSGVTDVSIRFTNWRDSWSIVGTDCRLLQPSTSFGWLDPPASFMYNNKTYHVPESARAISEFETGAVIMHEFGHILGMRHEHQNPRGKKISWKPQKVWEYYNCTLRSDWDWDKIYHNVLKEISKDSTNGSEFDPYSIMLYAFPGSLTCNYPDGTQANPQLSLLDIQWLKRIYPSTDRLFNIVPQPVATPIGLFELYPNIRYAMYIFILVLTLWLILDVYKYAVKIKWSNTT